MPNFTTATRVLDTIRAGDEAEYIRGTNRQKITDASNSKPFFDETEAKKMGLKVNVNWGDMTRAMAQASRQFMTAFWGGSAFFQVKIPNAPMDMKSDWEGMITQTLNRIMHDSLEYFEIHRGRWKAVSAFGIGPVAWENSYSWCPDLIGVEDLRIAADTRLDFKNLDWFAIRHIYTPGELVDKVFYGKPDSGWDKKALSGILKNYKEINVEFSDNKYDWENAPEKMAEVIRQDGGYYTADAMPGISLWHFYLKDKDEKGKTGWYLRVVPELAAIRGNVPIDFLYTSDTPVARHWNQILHCQFGDLNSKPPFMYQSVRSLGFLLMEPFFYDNLMRCRLMQHIFSNFNQWFRVIDPSDKGRSLFQELGNMSIVKSGVSVVPQTERHQIDGGLLEFGMAQTRQLMQEASSSYTQQPDSGTQKERTAFETKVMVQQVNAMLGGLLLTAFHYAKHEYREICRRFCLRHPKGWDLDEDVVTFQKEMSLMKIPVEWLNPERWQIEPQEPLGMGNPTMAAAEAQEILQIRPMLEPTAQQEALHDALVTIVGARRAARWAKTSGKATSPASKAAEADFAVMMHGVPVQMIEGGNPIDQIETLLYLTVQVVSRIKQQGGMATPQELAGLGTVSAYMKQLNQLIAKNPAEAPRSKQYAQAIAKVDNEIRAFAARLQQQQQAQQGQQGQAASPSRNGDAASRAQSQLVLAGTRAKIESDKAQQRMAHQDQEFRASQRRKDAEAMGEIMRENMKQRARGPRVME